MERSELVLFGVTVSGVHPDLIQKRYYGVSLNIDDAMILAHAKAAEDGWTEIEYEDVTKIGQVSFAPWLEQNESEVEQCQQ